MSRRARAATFTVAAIGCAALAAVATSRYSTTAAGSYGPLRQVVIARSPLKPGTLIVPSLASSLELRRVPARFVPPGALGDPSAALGRETAVAIPPGSYLLASELRLPAPVRPPGPVLARGRRPVEIAVSGAGSLLGGLAGASPTHVDVVVTAEPAGSGSGRTYVAAENVRLLALRPGPGGSASGAPAAATLALTRIQALQLIEAENFARQVRLLPRPASAVVTGSAPRAADR